MRMFWTLSFKERIRTLHGGSPESALSGQPEFLEITSAVEITIFLFSCNETACTWRWFQWYITCETYFDARRSILCQVSIIVDIEAVVQFVANPFLPIPSQKLQGPLQNCQADLDRIEQEIDTVLKIYRTQENANSENLFLLREVASMITLLGGSFLIFVSHFSYLWISLNISTEHSW